MPFLPPNQQRQSTEGTDTHADIISRQYLDVSILRSPAFKRSLHHAKKLFRRSANAIFEETGRTASQEVVLQLIISKGIPVILCSLPTNKI